MRVFAAIVLCAMAACAPAPQVRELSNASVNNLMAQDLPRFFATLRLASALSTKCPLFTYDAQAAEAITQARTRGQTYAAIQNAAGIDVESDVARRSFAAKHADRDTCSALALEVAEQTALTAVLIAP